MALYLHILYITTTNQMSIMKYLALILLFFAFSCSEEVVEPALEYDKFVFDVEMDRVNDKTLVVKKAHLLNDGELVSNKDITYSYNSGDNIFDFIDGTLTHKTYAGTLNIKSDTYTLDLDVLEAGDVYEFQYIGQLTSSKGKVIDANIHIFYN